MYRKSRHTTQFTSFYILLIVIETLSTFLFLILQNLRRACSKLVILHKNYHFTTQTRFFALLNVTLIAFGGRMQLWNSYNAHFPSMHTLPLTSSSYPLSTCSGPHSFYALPYFEKLSATPYKLAGKIKHLTP